MVYQGMLEVCFCQMTQSKPSSRIWRKISITFSPLLWNCVVDVQWFLSTCWKSASVKCQSQSLLLYQNLEKNIALPSSLWSCCGQMCNGLQGHIRSLYLSNARVKAFPYTRIWRTKKQNRNKNKTKQNTFSLLPLELGINSVMDA